MLIRKLLYEENFTINGARKQLRKIRNEEPVAPPPPGGGGQDALLTEIEKGLREIREIVA
jgi:hypothetical protein